jgi:metal-responsive CopG/Arc/MetJ family transcriptional regulator
MDARTLHMKLDRELLKAVDEAAARLGTTRSAFVHEGLREALGRVPTRELEQKHRAGYQRKPVTKDEFGAWLD